MPPSKRKKVKTRHPAQKGGDIQAAATPFAAPVDPDLQGFWSVVEEKVGFTLRDFQRKAIQYQLQRKDVLIHAATGMGKTLVAAAPHYHAAAEGMVTFMVSPLIALQNEQVETFKKEFKLKAMAINSNYGGCSPEALAALKDVNNGVQIVLISPELLLSSRFIDEVLRDKAFTSRILSIVVDEAHVVSHWGAGFRKKYGELGMIRAFIPRNTPWVAMSATLTAPVRHDVLRKLEYSEKYDTGHSTPTEHLSRPQLHHPKKVDKASDVPLTMLYADSVVQGSDLVEHLDALLPEHLRGCGLIRPFNAAFPHEYRTKALSDFREGIIRVLVCTDAAGMGCNIPDVDVVVQWKLPWALSLFVQRAGRAARAAGRNGKAILLVEKSAYNLMHEYQATNNTKGQKTNAKPPKRTRKQVKAHAEKNGVKRGGVGGKTDGVVGEKRNLEPDEWAVDEGLLAFVQSMLCRRDIVTKVYRNKITGPAIQCCDLCDPTLLNECRPGPAPLKPRKQSTKNDDAEPCAAAKTALLDWRVSILKKDFPNAVFGPGAILSDALVDGIALAGRVESKERLEELVGTWKWNSKYGAPLLEILKSIPASEYEFDPRPLPAPAPEVVSSTAEKRKAVDDEDELDGGGERQEAMITEQSTSMISPPSTTPSTSTTGSQPEFSSMTFTFRVDTPSQPSVQPVRDANVQPARFDQTDNEQTSARRQHPPTPSSHLAYDAAAPYTPIRTDAVPYHYAQRPPQSQNGYQVPAPSQTSAQYPAYPWIESQPVNHAPAPSTPMRAPVQAFGARQPSWNETHYQHQPWTPGPTKTYPTPIQRRPHTTAAARLCRQHPWDRRHNVNTPTKSIRTASTQDLTPLRSSKGKDTRRRTISPPHPTYPKLLSAATLHARTRLVLAKIVSISLYYETVLLNRCAGALQAVKRDMPSSYLLEHSANPLKSPLPRFTPQKTDQVDQTVRCAHLPYNGMMTITDFNQVIRGAKRTGWLARLQAEGRWTCARPTSGQCVAYINPLMWVPWRYMDSV
ncbi:hypothetical protein NMY22_g10385 [Coprinellus aureogranulatus]|nr:hypothetical protein NMY22_g10385 [Coprinellus aureogranulatus]